MSLNSPLAGGCHCGAVRYEVTAQPVSSVICHCTDCQKIGGGAGTSLVLVPREALAVTGGLAEYGRPGDSGQKVTLKFCPACGTRLFGFPDALPHLASVTVLSLDEPDAYEPEANIYAGSARHWDILDPAIPAFEKVPPRR